MNVLGISAYFHDSAAALICNGKIVAAAEEERFTRTKHDKSFPCRSIRYCLSTLERDQKIDAVVYYEKPFLKFDRLIETYFAFAPRGFESFEASFPLWAKEKIFLKQSINQELKKILDYQPDLLFSKHHLSHAASCFYPSPFVESSVLCLDGVGEWETTSLWHGQDKTLTPLQVINFPHSLGLLYSSLTAYLGFRPNTDEYKVMGLAPYGEPLFYQIIKDNIIDIKEDGSFHLNLSYFSYCTELKMYSPQLEKLFKRKARSSCEELEKFHADVASSLQKVLEEVILKLSKCLIGLTGSKQICLAGGVALNCVANSRVLKSEFVDRMWVQPAAGDSGGAIGAALWAYFNVLNPTVARKVDVQDSQKGSFLGPLYSDDEIKLALKFEKYLSYDNWDSVCEKVSSLLEQGLVGGVFQGRMEFGPRALGGRSIIADARLENGQRHINQKIKFREDFRPFAPMVLADDVNKYFDFSDESPYMLFTAEVLNELRVPNRESEDSSDMLKKINLVRSRVPAVTHVDYTSRIQTVDAKRNPKIYALLSHFKNKTGCSVLVNTSFNRSEEPIVCSPEDAINCYKKTALDFLVLENYILIKENCEC